LGVYRKVSKSRGSFPNDEAVIKLFYLALNNIAKKWSTPLKDWKPALNRFAIQFEDRMPHHYINRHLHTIQDTLLKQLFFSPLRLK